MGREKKKKKEKKVKMDNQERVLLKLFAFGKEVHATLTAICSSVKLAVSIMFVRIPPIEVRTCCGTRSVVDTTRRRRLAILFFRIDCVTEMINLDLRLSQGSKPAS